jgi:hypothetical protein
MVSATIRLHTNWLLYRERDLCRLRVAFVRVVLDRTYEPVVCWTLERDSYSQKCVRIAYGLKIADAPHIITSTLIHTVDRGTILSKHLEIAAAYRT